MKTIVAMLFLLLPAFGQTIQITDNSPSDSPITFKGAITFGPGSTDVACIITGHSNASRVIVAYGGVVDVMRPDGHHFVPPFTHDHFFKDAPRLAMMSPQLHLDWDLDYDCSGFGQNDGHYLATPQSPSMSVSATFVQLDDGSVWGDPQAIKEVMFQRQEAIAYLQSLKASSDLTQALATAPPLKESDQHVLWERFLRWISLSKGTIPQAQAELDQCLTAAQAHAAWLK
jgi:hypothetical protein